MTSRERFAATMAYGRPDRPPLFEEGLRDEVLERWREQGLDPDVDPRALVAYDRRERVPVDLGPRPGMGRPIETHADLRELRSRLNPDDPGLLPEDWAERTAEWRVRDYVLEWYVHSGFFLTQGADRWDTVERLLYRVHDDRDLVRGVMEAYSECAVGVARRVLAEVDIDFAAFSEPISGPDRPLLSPRMYADLVLPTYRPIVEALHAGGCPTVVFQTYANSRVLLPGVVACGFDCLWAVEAHPEAMDYLEIRREFGKRLRLIGGIDLDTLRLGRTAIRREMEARVLPLLADGGYIPLADGRVRPDVPFDRYMFYRELLEVMTAGRQFAEDAGP